MNEEKQNYEIDSDNNKINDKKEINENNIINNESNQLEISEIPTIISTDSNIPNETINDFIGADEFQKKEISKINRSKNSSKLLSLNEGLSDFSHLAISYFFKDILKLSPSESSFFRSLISFPYIFQPLFGLMSDLFPIFGYKRKTYLILFGCFNFILWLILSLKNFTQFFSIFILFLINLNCTFINACSGGIVVEVSKKLTLIDKKLERFNASHAYKNTGMVLSSILRGFIIELFGIKINFFLAGILSLINVAGGVIYYESNLNETKEEQNYQIIKNNNISEAENEYNHLNIKKLNFFSVLNNKKILIPLFLVLFFSSTPSYFESSFYYLTDVKKFNPRNFGELTIYIMLLMLGISILYKNYLKSFNKRKIIFWSILISFIFSCFFNVYIYFDLESKILVILSISLYVTIKSICSKPMLDLAFLSCPKGLEGSVMGLFGSALSFGKTISTFLGSLLTSYFKIEKSNYNNFNFLILVHNLISLASMIGLLFITDELLEMKENGKVFNYNKNRSNNNIEIGVDIYNEKTKLKESN